MQQLSLCGVKDAVFAERNHVVRDADSLCILCSFLCLFGDVAFGNVSAGISARKAGDQPGGGGSFADTMASSG